MKQTLRVSILASALAAAMPALAQQPPDAGQILQQEQRQLPRLPAPGAAPAVQTPAETVTPPGGQRVTLQGARVTGNTVFDEPTLLAVIGEVQGQSFDLAGLRGLAQRISEHYRGNGYPFARALLPAQRLTDGMLEIQVIEGRYGEVSAQGDADLTASAQGFLAGLKPGEVIESSRLERTTLILDDLPGVSTSPLIRPGQEPGTGDLIVQVGRERMFRGELGADNHGNRYTGAGRLRANLQADSPFLLGDQFLLRSLYTEEGMWLGNLNYSLPVGVSGLRGNIGYAHTSYELGKDFSALDAQGTARVYSAGLSYPIVRSQRSNLSMGVSFQHKRLNDQQGATGTDDDKESNSLPIGLQFDRRDGLAGGGVTFGGLTYTPGELSLDDTLEAADRASNTDSRGRFSKWNLDVARLQATGVQSLTLYGRFSGQWASKNLDSSESFGLGGATGVRAYPQGEGVGDEGWFIQLEARYQAGAFAPYAFYDQGEADNNAKPGRITPAVTDNTRRIAGGGLGVRYSQGAWHGDVALAWRSQGGEPESDTRDRNPRAWLTAAYRF